MYYVTPYYPNPDCPTGKSCLTIDEYTQQNSFIGSTDDNITLLFLDGEHKLTAQNFLIDYKTKLMLKMAPDKSDSNVVIRMSNKTSMKVQNIFKIEMVGIKLFSQASYHDTTSACVSISEVGFLSFVGVSIEYCQMSLEGVARAIITGLIASKSLIYLAVNKSKQTVAIRNSDFHISTLNISESTEHVYTADNTMSVLSLVSSSMNNSLLTVKLQYPHVQLSILNSSIFSRGNLSQITGITAEISNKAKLFAYIKDCYYVGNSQGIGISADEDSHLQLTIDQCYIANNVSEQGTASSFGIVVRADGNSYAELSVNHCLIVYNGLDSGGISVSRSTDKESNAVTVTSIKSTTVTGNNLRQIEIVGSSGLATVTVFNCTIKGDGIFSQGMYFKAGQSPKNSMFINITNSRIEDNTFGIWIDSSLDTLKNSEQNAYMLEAYLKGNNISSVSTARRETGVHQGYGLQISDGSNIVLSITNCRFILNKDRAIILYALSVMVRISETVIAQNGNGIEISNSYELEPKHITMIIEDTVFQENTGLSLGVPDLLSDGSELFNITLRNVSFCNNTIFGANTGIVQVDKRVSLSIGDSCVFSGNLGSPILALSTTVSLSGAVTFKDNVAFQGGAISLRMSVLKLQSVNHTNTHISFVNNKATNLGGSIYVEQSFNLNRDAYSGSICFYEIQGVSFDDLKNSAVKITVTFSNNTALNGGTDIIIWGNTK